MSPSAHNFLALAVLDLDPDDSGLICMEEPENGVHPERIPPMLHLLGNLTVDVERPVSSKNLLRQVVVNTHSPAVVAQVPEGSLLVALAREDEDDYQGRFQKVEFHPLPGTWRAEVPESLEPVAFAKLLAYLNPAVPQDFLGLSRRQRRRRVVDRDDVQQLLIPFHEDV